MTIDNAWALGQWDDDNGVFRAWKRSIENSRIEAQNRSDIASVLPHPVQTSLVFLSYGLDVPHRTLRDLQATNSKMLIYIPEASREISSDAAIDL